MLSLQRKGYTSQEVKNALHGVYAPVQMRFHYDLLDADNNYIRTLDNVLDGEVSCSSLAHIKRTATFRMRETGQIDYLSDRIQPFVELNMPEIKRKHDDYALAFDGVDDEVFIGNPTVLQVNNSLTLQVEFDVDDISTDGGGLCQKFSSGGWANTSYGFVRRNSDSIHFNIASDTNSSSVTSSLVLGEKATFTGVFNANDGVLFLYKNGEVVDTNSTSITQTRTDGDFVIGGDWYSDGSSPYFPGKVYNVCIWNRGLTQTEIQANMNKRLTGNEPNLVGLWRFNEGAGTIAKDSTANGNDGTIYGAKYEKAGIELETIPSKYINFPLGIFLLSSPTRADQDNMIIRDIEAYDGLIVLKEDKFIDRYNVSAGTNYVDAVI